MPYFAKSVFLTVSYLFLMSGIADSKMFFVSVLTFVGGILFDLYFSYQTLNNMGENFSVTIIKTIIYILSIVAILGLLVSILGICDIFCVINNNSIKYIVFKNDELKNVLKMFPPLQIELGNLLIFLLIEIVSCLPDFLIHRMELKEKNKKRIKGDE